MESFEESEETDSKATNEQEQRNSLAAPINNNFKVISKKLSSSQNCLNDIKKDIGFSLQIGKYQVNELKRKSQVDLIPRTTSNLSTSLFNIAAESSIGAFSDTDGFDVKKISTVNSQSKTPKLSKKL